MAGGISSKYLVRCAAGSQTNPTGGILICDTQGVAKMVLPGPVISRVQRTGKPNVLEILVEKTGGDASTDRQLIELMFDNEPQCFQFSKIITTVIGLKVKRQVAGSGSEGKRQLKKPIDLDVYSLKDTLILEGSCQTDTVLTAKYVESKEADAQLREKKQLYPFIRINWFLSKAPGVVATMPVEGSEGTGKLYDKQFSVANVLEFNVLSRMAGHYIFVEAYIYSESKNLKVAMKGPVLPSADLSKRLLKIIVGGQSSMSIGMVVDDLIGYYGNMTRKKDYRKLTTILRPTTGNMIDCRLLLSYKGLSIIPDIELFKGLELPGLYTEINFTWGECYFSLPHVCDEETGNIFQEENVKDAYYLKLEFYSSDGESWFQIPIRFLNVMQRDIAWHYAMLMSNTESSTMRKDRALYERDMTIGNVANVQGAFKHLWKHFDYETFTNSIAIPQIFSATKPVPVSGPDRGTAVSGDTAGGKRASILSKKKDTAIATTRKDKEQQKAREEAAKTSYYEYEATGEAPPDVAYQEWESDSE
ncbi:hypothetical protein GNI_134290 [Gregarina niphandrodes]|uniref:Uncharacterized protein n=1 Tax=Gregarina niphandrodes TaxID=110365 RepID=A0A023B105_GRENI|nr:hypothetical protein GNI_134290 [Gregarina niphandrodes]EZG46255.1 hypothetical protein GNI_134290 [Gregarina niphandrodes]|eukprot:XP_011132325.1 hypothetical protein GNI_134290 [Gregarina niphandrodes]